MTLHTGASCRVGSLVQWSATWMKADSQLCWGTTLHLRYSSHRTRSRSAGARPSHANTRSQVSRDLRADRTDAWSAILASGEPLAEAVDPETGLTDTCRKA